MALSFLWDVKHGFVRFFTAWKKKWKFCLRKQEELGSFIGALKGSLKRLEGSFEGELRAHFRFCMLLDIMWHCPKCIVQGTVLE